MTNAHHIRISPDDPTFDLSDSDPTIDPTEDFYRFVNGGWIDSNPVPPEYGAWGAGHEVHARNEEILKKLLDAASTAETTPGTPDHWVGTYYRSGMDTERIEALDIAPIEVRLSAISAIASIEDLATVVADLHQIGVGALFDVAVIPDFEDATVNMLWFGQSGLGLPDRDYYTRDDDTSVQLLADYEVLVAAMFELLGDDTDTAATKSSAVLAIEHAIANASYSNVQMRDVDLITNKYDRATLAGLMPAFKLDRYVGNIGADAATHVNIDNEDFYPTIDSLLQTVPLSDWTAYLQWHLVRSTASSLPTRFEETAFAFYGTKLGGQQEQKARWKRVLAAGGSDIGQLISQLYVRDNFPPEAKSDVEHLVERLFDAMRSSLNDIAWMSDETKVEAFTKLDGFDYKIGYPDEWRDYSALVLEDDTWLANRLACRSFEFRRQMDQIGQPIDPHEWSMAPHVVNAYYHPLRNEIVFPAGILQAPFYSTAADAAVNFGGIGAVIGHEITHGFDDQGSRFDAEGNVRDWWTEEDRAEFDRRAAVMVEQFNAYEVEEGLNVNGELTLGENIADLGGLKIALAALAAELGDERPSVGGLSPEQRFFMSWARVWRRNYTDEYVRMQVNSDPHSPSDLRCSGPMSNMAAFANAFGITDDSPQMREPRSRVDIW